jgi:hypothetical protein
MVAVLESSKQAGTYIRKDLVLIASKKILGEGMI